MSRVLLILVLVSLLAAPLASAGSVVAAGYQEAVFSVSDADEWIELFESVAGWQVVHDGTLDEAQIDAWDLPSSVTAREVVVANPGTSRGFVRLLQFGGMAQRQIRSDASVWDTGGWFDVNFRVVDLAQTHKALQARGWQASSGPVEFSFGPFIVREWIARGPDGIVFANIERVQPPLEDWPQLKRMSRIFNATQIVPDIEEARAFYRDKLGFETYLDHNAPSETAGPNVLGLPYNLAPEITRLISIVHPTGINEGSVELLQFDGLEGEDFSPHAVPPNLGIISLRFPVADMQAFRDHATLVGLDVIVEPSVIDMPPYGERTIMAVRGPGGAWLEFYEQAQAGEGE